MSLGPTRPPIASTALAVQPLASRNLQLRVFGTPEDVPAPPIHKAGISTTPDGHLLVPFHDHDTREAA